MEENLTADARLPSGIKRKGATLKLGSSLCRKAEPNSSITYLNIQNNMKLVCLLLGNSKLTIHIMYWTQKFEWSNIDPLIQVVSQQ